MNVIPDLNSIAPVGPSRNSLDVDRAGAGRNANERSFSSYLDDSPRQTERADIADRVDATQGNAADLEDQEDTPPVSVVNFNYHTESQISLAAVVEPNVENSTQTSNSISQTEVGYVGSELLIADAGLAAEGTSVSGEVGDALTSLNSKAVPDRGGELQFSADSEALDAVADSALSPNDAATVVDAASLSEDGTATLAQQASSAAATLASGSSLTASNGEVSSSERAVEATEDDALQIESAVSNAEQSSSGALSGGFAESNSQGNGNDSFLQQFDSTVAVQVAPANSTPFESGINQAPSSLVQGVTDVSSVSSGVEVANSLQEISAPTSQLKVAILANASSIENESSNIIQVDLHPAELGRLQVRIEQTGDQLHARIVATEIASSELLLQDRQHLIEALNDLGFSESSVDISHGQHSDPETARSLFDEQQRLAFDSSEEETAAVELQVLEPIKSTGINFVA